MNAPLTGRSLPPLLQALVLGFLAVPFFVNLGASSIWDANEAFYAETPREMLESGDYLAPKFNYQTRAQKPPLTYWIVLSSYKLFGVSEFSARLPSALAAWGTVLFAFGTASIAFSRAAGILAAVVIATCVRFFALARKLPIDALLLFWLAGTAFFLLLALRRGSAKYWGLAYAFAALGFLTKGPIALLIPFAAYGAWSVCAGRFRLADTRPILGLAIVSTIILPWYLRVYQVHGWEYIATFFLSDNIGRFASESFGPSRGLFYYLPVYLVDFFPWSLISAGALYWLWRSGMLRNALRNPGLGLPLAWCLLVIAVFSLSKNKQEYYIASVYPMMAVMIAGASGLAAAGGAGSRARSAGAGWRVAFGIVAIAFLALAVAVPMLIGKVLPEGGWHILFLPSVILATAAIALAWSVVRSSLSAAFISAGIALYLLLVTAVSLHLPAIEPMRPVKKLAGTIKAISQPEDDIGYFGAAHPSMVFYLRREIFEEYDGGRMAARFRQDKRVFCILTEKDYDNFVGKKDLILYVLDRRPRLQIRLRFLLDDRFLAEQELLLVSNRPPPDHGIPKVR